MEFKQGVRVFTATGNHVGRIEQIVMDPQTKELTHIVVKKGFLFTEDKIVPLSLIASADEKAVYLREDAGDLYLLPPFEETHYIPLDDLERGVTDYSNVPSLYWLPPAGDVIGYPHGFSYPPPYPTHTTQNIPEGTVAIHKGAEVYSSNDVLLGHVDEVLTDSPTDRVSYFVISSGILAPSKRRVPISWVRDVFEDRLILHVGKSIVERLPEYYPEQQ